MAIGSAAFEVIYQHKHELTHKLREIARRGAPWHPGFSPEQADEHVIRYYYIRMERKRVKLH